LPAGAAGREDKTVNPFELLTNPHLLHAAVVHFPVALGVLGIPLVAVCGIVGKNATLRWVTCISYLFLAGISFGTVITGQQASTGAPYRLSPEVQTLAERHEMLAQCIWIAAIVTAVLVILCGVKSERLRGAFAVLAFLASLITGIWMGAVACYGTALAYKHGVGVEASSPIVPKAAFQPEPGKEPQVSAPQTSAPQPPAAPGPSQPGPPSNLRRLRAPSTPPNAANQEGFLQSTISYWRGAIRKVWP